MKKFKYILISSLIIYIFNFGAHFLYDFLPWKIIAIFFPTNESIFQHLKMMFTCFFIFYLLLNMLAKKLNYKNIALACLISSLTTIFSFLIIYLPIYFIIGENMPITLILLFVTICFGQYISSFILKKEQKVIFTIYSILLIVLILFVNGYLTFNPLHNFLFWDPTHKTYNIV